MLQLKIDTAPIAAAQKKAEAAIAKLPSLFQAAVKNAAADERANHRYINRTGRLQKSTQGRVFQATKKLVRAELVMTQPYASYVESKGLSDIKDRAQDVEFYLQDVLDNLFSHL